jgi:hypothetical protein
MAVELNVLLPKIVHKPAVLGASVAGCCINAGNPNPPEIIPSLLSIVVGVLACM